MEQKIKFSSSIIFVPPYWGSKSDFSKRNTITLKLIFFSFNFRRKILSHYQIPFHHRLNFYHLGHYLEVLPLLASIPPWTRWEHMFSLKVQPSASLGSWFMWVSFAWAHILATKHDLNGSPVQIRREAGR